MSVYRQVMCVVLWCMAQAVFAFVPDSVTIACYAEYRTQAPNLVRYIHNNQPDSVELVYAGFSDSCKTKDWNQLVHLFLISVKYPEQIDHLNENEMRFVIDYAYCIRHAQIEPNSEDSIYYVYNLMPAFYMVHRAIQSYWEKLYESLTPGSRQHSFIGTLLNKHSLFFDELNEEAIHLAPSSTYQSYVSNKEQIKKASHLYMHINIGFSFNKQIGNATHYEWLGLDVLRNRYMTGLSIGVGVNSSNPTYTITYNGIPLRPRKTECFTFTTWDSYILYNQGWVKPFIGGGLSIFDWRHSFTVNGEKKELSTFGVQFYPEVGLLLGKISNQIRCKVHASYRFNFEMIDYAQDRIWGTQSSFSHNITSNDIRFGFSLLIMLIQENKHKGQMLKMY